MMEYYYAVEGKKHGPITREELQELIKTKKINAKTLIWKQGMAEWKELGEMNGQKAALAAGTVQTSGRAEGIAGASACSECGRSFSTDQMIRFQDRWICAACKPVFVQKMKEGTAVNLSMDHAGFWLRFGAFMIDYIILSIVNMIIYIPLFILMATSMNSPEANPVVFITVQLIVMFLGLAVQVGYETWFIGKYAATPGKMACKIKVVVATGEKVSYLRALGRFFAKWISYMTLMIGFIMAGFDSEKRALHDMICETRVIRI